MHNPKWCLFYDVHTLPACPDVGEGFDADAFTDRIKACGVDYVVFHARCNLGMAYYDTKVGIRHPSLKYDLFGKLAEACQERDIALTAYVNLGLSHEEALLNRGWCVLTPEGYTYKPNRLDHFFRMMCYNTEYGDHAVEMIREIVSGYPVAGLFLDCMHQTSVRGRRVHPRDEGARDRLDGRLPAPRVRQPLPRPNGAARRRGGAGNPTGPAALLQRRGLRVPARPRHLPGVRVPPHRRLGLRSAAAVRPVPAHTGQTGAEHDRTLPSVVGRLRRHPH
ncbi:MAG: hypothetical protein GW867_33580 [Armatimonadetes bacterium]|nr:hypothetical protein [Armatimonadota bacterium]